jgi:phosphoribosylglycinamide formyltransferase 1
VLPDDDPLTLAARILAQEHIAYAEAIDRVLSGKYRFAGRRFVPSDGN